MENNKTMAGVRNYQGFWIIKRRAILSLPHRPHTPLRPPHTPLTPLTSHTPHTHHTHYHTRPHTPHKRPTPPNTEAIEKRGPELIVRYLKYIYTIYCKKILKFLKIGKCSYFFQTNVYNSDLASLDPRCFFALYTEREFLADASPFQ